MKIRLNWKGWAALLIITIITVFAVASLAQVASPAPASTPGIVNTLTTVNSKLPTSIPPIVMTLLGLLVTELAARGIPTSKPYSWFWLLSAIFSLVGTIVMKLSQLSLQIATAFNNTGTPTPNPPPGSGSSG